MLCCAYSNYSTQSVTNNVRLLLRAKLKQEENLTPRASAFRISMAQGGDVCGPKKGKKEALRRRVDKALQSQIPQSPSPKLIPCRVWGLSLF